MVDPEIVETYTIGKEGFIVALCESLGIPEIINKALGSVNGRPPDIPYGIDAMMMMVNMCDDHMPLSRLQEYYQYKDLEGLFHHPINLEQINDDRFGGFLDLFHEAGCKKIFSQIAAKAIALYGIQVTNINFDTTSKVMWGLYETYEGTEGVIKMDFGHSKDRREDKKQIKFGIGCANGLVVDATVLSGNKDDKTYNTDTINALDANLHNLNVDSGVIYDDATIMFTFNCGIEWFVSLEYKKYLSSKRADERKASKEEFLKSKEVKDLLKFCKEPRTIVRIFRGR